MVHGSLGDFFFFFFFFFLLLLLLLFSCIYIYPILRKLFEHNAADQVFIYLSRDPVNVNAFKQRSDCYFRYDSI